jgi:hypothetical protein
VARDVAAAVVVEAVAAAADDAGKRQKWKKTNEPKIKS